MRRRRYQRECVAPALPRPACPSSRWCGLRSRCDGYPPTLRHRQEPVPAVGGGWATIRAVGTLEALASRLPAGAVSSDPEILAERAVDCWALALLRRVRGDTLPVPAAVVFPASTEDVATVLTWACQTRTAVIPRGGGSGVCGGAEASAGSVVLDLSRMDQITGLDPVSRVVYAQAGVRGSQLEDVLADHGLTVGH